MMDLKSRFLSESPNAFFLQVDQAAELESYLKGQGWIESSRSITGLGVAGEGNMNLTLRAVLDDGSSLIVKQARPWVEKFPQVDAPVERATVEAEFYRQVAVNPQIAQFSPALVGVDERSSLLLVEDLGQASDLTKLYFGGALDESVLRDLMTYLSALHRGFQQPDCGFTIRNAAMRALNAEHIFNFPFVENNGLDLDGIAVGLAASAQSCREDGALMEQIRGLNQRYLADGDTLLHGDFFLGSILQTDCGVKVIDPEFCFFGDAEFDLGVFVAHLHMSGQKQSLIDSAFQHYAAPDGFSRERCEQYAGMEILRRLLGLAQLPLNASADRRLELVALGRKLLMQA